MTAFHAWQGDKRINASLESLISRVQDKMYSETGRKNSKSFLTHPEINKREEWVPYATVLANFHEIMCDTRYRLSVSKEKLKLVKREGKRQYRERQEPLPDSDNESGILNPHRCGAVRWAGGCGYSAW